MTRNLRARRGSQSGSPLPAPDCDTRYVDQWPEEWVLVGRGTAATPATALRPGDVVPESGPARVKSELSEAHAVRLVQYGRERGLGAPD